MATALQTRPRLARTDGATAGWAVSAGLVPYPLAVAAMEARAEAIVAGAASELVWLLEHPALYTAGVSAKPADLLAPERLPVFRSGRGGQYTWHGPGQRVCYVMLDVSRRGRDVRAFVCALEEWLILALARLGVEARRRPGAVGVWVDTLMGEAKIAALGVRLRRWVSFHGVALNIDPDLTHFEGIVPCGIRNGAVTSLAALGRPAAMTAVDGALAAAFAEVFGPISPAPPPLP